MAYLRKRGKVWYFQFIDGHGNKREEKGCRDKKETESMAREAEVHAARVRLGQADPVAPRRKRMAEDDLTEYLGFLRSREITPKHLAQTETRLRAILTGLGVSRLNELDAVKVAKWLSEQRQSKADPDTGKAIRGMSAQTSNHYLTRIKSFVRWAVRHRRLAYDALTTLEPLNAKLDPRHRRSVLSREEFESLIRTTMASGIFRNLSGEDRAMMYITAAYTGLRASELASLTVGQIVIDDHQATIRVQAAHTKNREKADQPIHPHLAALLRAYLEGADSTEHVWPGPWWKRGAFILRADLMRAGIAYRDAQGFRDFHALRHRFGYELARAGVAPKVAQTLMRHSSINLTMDIYADHVGAEENAIALGMLPPIPLPLPTGAPKPAFEDTDGWPEDRFAARLPHDIPGQEPTQSGKGRGTARSRSLTDSRKSVSGTGLVGGKRGRSVRDGRKAPAGFEPAVEVLQT